MNFKSEVVINFYIYSYLNFPIVASVSPMSVVKFFL